MENKEQKQKELIKLFDDIFRTRASQKIDVSIIDCIYKRFEEKIRTPNEEYKKLRKELVEKLDMFKATMSKEQIKLFEEYLDIVYQMYAVENEQHFYFGWMMSTTIAIEKL